MNRDSQRQRVYDAEREAFTTDGHFKEVFSFHETKSFVAAIIQSSYYRELNGWKRIKVKDGRRCRNAYYYPCQRAVTFPKWSRNKYVVCHELSHALAHRILKNESGGHHGTFCAVYASIIGEMVSLTDALRLIEMFDKHGVRYNRKFLSNHLVEALAVQVNSLDEVKGSAINLKPKKQKKRDKRERFVTLAEKRVNRVLHQLDLIGNLSNKSHYHYQKDDVDSIYKQIKSAIKKAEMQFKEGLN